MQPAPYSSLEPWTRDEAHDRITIALVNNMPDAALRTTERQFRELLGAATQGLAVCLRVFSFPDLRREQAGRTYVAQHHEDIRELWSGHVDGLIVTGTEPRAPILSDEPYWPTLARLIDWAEEHTVSTIWSCLAAHAAVFHCHGICRHALQAKLSGVFECMTVADHAILAGLPSHWRLPHSRYNDLPKDALVARGYQILSISPDAGADLFARQGKSLFLFFQGHPEYDPGALYREYRRDVGRFLAGERDYPAVPANYFDEGTAAAMRRFREQAIQHRSPDLLSNFPTWESEHRVAHAWHGPAVRLYANWLAYLASARSRTLVRPVSQQRPVHVAI